jgi:hypothetical protein
MRQSDTAPRSNLFPAQKIFQNLAGFVSTLFSVTSLNLCATDTELTGNVAPIGAVLVAATLPLAAERTPAQLAVLDANRYRRLPSPKRTITHDFGIACQSDSKGLLRYAARKTHHYAGDWCDI